MTYTRQNVWDLGSTWAEPIYWYARGVQAMQSRPLNNLVSWRFYAAIHGFNATRWQRVGYLSNTDQPPTQQQVATFWRQCQHGSWYFLPWHRGYVLALEANIRHSIIPLGGPADWALPYWNYFKPNEAELPPAFASQDWPGDGPNPLFVTQRYGPSNNGDVFVPMNWVNLDAMQEPDFTGVSSGGSPGFGGVDTGFSHGGPVHGALESQPHDIVHVAVGGADPANPNDPGLRGLMTDPNTAGLDPIFWLHHANIDRLWESWNQSLATHTDPNDPDWLGGPSSVGGRGFAMPMPDGSTWTYTPAEMTSISTLGYTYDDFDPAGVPLPPTPARQRRRRAAQPEEDAVARNVELVGANDESVSVGGGEAQTAVRMDTTMRRKVATSLRPRRGGPAAEADAPPPDRVFLNLENVRGPSDVTAFHVYVGVPEGEDAADHPERLAGTVAPFGLAEASDPDAEHGGQGLTYVLEITGIVDAMDSEDQLDVETLPVRLVPASDRPEHPEVTVGRVSVFRQGD